MLVGYSRGGQGMMRFIINLPTSTVLIMWCRKIAKNDN